MADPLLRAEEMADLLLGSSRLGLRRYANHCLRRRLQPLLRLSEAHAIPLAGSPGFRPEDAAKGSDCRHQVLHSKGRRTTRKTRCPPRPSHLPPSAANAAEPFHLLRPFPDHGDLGVSGASSQGGQSEGQGLQDKEKGSDVNLATHLLVDGVQNAYDLAVVVSNDGNLKAPVEYVRTELQKPVGVLNPRKNRSYALSPTNLPRGSFYKPIRPGVLRSSQFAPALSDADGSFSKPAGW